MLIIICNSLKMMDLYLNSFNNPQLNGTSKYNLKLTKVANLA